MSKIVKRAVKNKTANLMGSAIAARIGAKIAAVTKGGIDQEDPPAGSEDEQEAEEERQRRLEEERKRIENLDNKDFEFKEVDTVEYEKLTERKVTDEEKLKKTALTLWRVRGDAIKREREVFFPEKGFRLVVPHDESGSFGATFGSDTEDTFVLLDVTTFEETARFTFSDASQHDEADRKSKIHIYHV